MKKKFDWHTFMKVDIDSTTIKLYYFRYNNNNNGMEYECEEYTYRDKQVLDLKYGESSKEYFDEIFSHQNQKGSSPTVYYEYKGMGWKSFGEEISSDELHRN